ncbi:hypothetical protein MMC34_006975 [Xylographa carneopallida]|nr:hypothetical protein [Xylographa carneopallida]
MTPTTTVLALTHLLLLPLLTTANPLPNPLPTPTATAYTPTATYANGTANPFYPCGRTASEITACPYRCYTPTGALLPECYTAADAHTLSASYRAICVQCLASSSPADRPGGCTPLSTYFAGQNPSPCGVASSSHRLPGCAWLCAEAQVPFDLCSAGNATGQFERCTRCVPQCSSPWVVLRLPPSGGAPPQPARAFSLSNGTCESGEGAEARRERVACPWRCTFAGYPAGTRFCSLTDKTDTGGARGGFTTCEECVLKV